MQVIFFCDLSDIIIYIKIILLKMYGLWISLFVYVVELRYVINYTLHKYGHCFFERIIVILIVVEESCFLF